MTSTSLIHHALAILLLAFAASCGDVSPPNPPPACTGTSCACEAATSCDFTTETCGGSCSLACGNEARCNGTCGESCSIDCGADAACAVTLGASGSISCKEGSACDVTCTGGCSVSCANTAVCRIKCAGETDFTAVSGGASC